MEYSSDDLVKVKKILIELLNAFDVFCSKNEIKYYACAGTCLGAIRHKGFIPWDDDIDVVMPRSDYEKFLSLRHTLDDSGYEINDLSKEGYSFAFAKFCETKTTLVENNVRPFLMGQFIDVFPLDEVEDTKVCRKLFLDKSRSIGRYSRCVSRMDLKHFFRTKSIKKRTIELMFALIRHPLKKFYIEKFKRIERDIRKQTGKHLMFYGGNYGFNKEFHNKEWFGDGIRVPFENTSIVIPADYNSYLTKLYGNYMVPPPIEKQVSHHYRYFFDLKKRWKLEDVMNLKLDDVQIINYKYE